MSAVTPGLRVVVVGGGVIGLACADELVRARRDVTVCDPRPACGSTYAAVGMLAPGGEAWLGEEALLRLGIDSPTRWPGTDSGDAAGLGADVATCAALGVPGTCAVTAVTAQDTTGVHRVVPIDGHDVRAQIRSVLDDLPVAAAETGMLDSAEAAHVVADLLAGSLPCVVDPGLVATSGAALGDVAVVRADREVLLLRRRRHSSPRRDGSTDRAARDADPEELALTVHAPGPAVVLTGGEPRHRLHLQRGPCRPPRPRPRPRGRCPVGPSLRGRGARRLCSLGARPRSRSGPYVFNQPHKEN